LIKQVLHLMINEGIVTKKQMAQSLGIEEETLDDILQLLVSRGMLRVNDCKQIDSTLCSSCAYSEGCSPEASTRMEYFVTEKGRRYAAQ